MKYWGINALNHGSSIAVFNDNTYTQYTYNSDTLSIAGVHDLFRKHGEPDHIFWYERPWIKKARQLYAGQYSTAFDTSTIPRFQLAKCDLGHIPVTYTPHHASHAAAGYYTSEFNHCAIIILDAIGEFECATIWEAKDGEMKKIWCRSYPHSLGLFYSAFTKLIGLTPIKDEGQLEKMSKSGRWEKYYDIVKDYIGPKFHLTKNLHRGVYDWPYPITGPISQQNIAAAVQRVFEDQLKYIIDIARSEIDSDCLVYMGGCAMNRTANTKIVEPVYKNIWTLPNPGDPSSSIGAVAYHIQQKVKEQK
jgi:carbamoyltransferase